MLWVLKNASYFLRVVYSFFFVFVNINDCLVILNRCLKISELTEAERGQIIGLFKDGAAKASIKKTLGFSKTTVIRTIQNFQKRNSLVTQPRSGRPKLLSFEHQRTLNKSLRIITVNQLNKLQIHSMKKLDLMLLRKLLQEICMTIFLHAIQFLKENS